MTKIHYVTGRILVVDDSSVFRSAAAELLAERGLIVMMAPDAEQALIIAASECPDGILLDVNLPGMDGLAVAGLLAAICPRSRIVLTSGEVCHLPAGTLDDGAIAAFVPKHELAVADLSSLFLPGGT